MAEGNECAFKSYYLPEWLSSQCKWDGIVKELNSRAKFDAFALKVLDEDKINVFDFHSLMSDMARDVAKYHNNPKIVDIMFNLDELIQMLNKWITDQIGRFQNPDCDWTKKFQM